MRKVLLINRKIELEENLQKLKQKLEATGELLVSTASFADLNLLINGENSSIRNRHTGEDLADFDKILCITTAPFDRRYVFSSYGCYCRKKGVKMADDEFGNTNSKLYEMWRLWEKDVPVPKTAYGTPKFLGECLVDTFENRAILKSVRGTKGRNNHFVQSPVEIYKIIEENPESEYILQEYIPSDGDYRIITLGYEPYYAAHFVNRKIYWRAENEKHGAKRVIPLSELDPEIIEMARAASKAVHRRFAGVDIITNKETGKNYVLEVNHTPQVLTGSFVDEKADALRDYFLTN